MIFLVFLLLAAGAAGGVGYWYMERRKQLALAPSEADEKIILALTEGTLSDADLNDIGIDANAFRIKHGLIEPKALGNGGAVSLRGGVSGERASSALQEIVALMARPSRQPMFGQSFVSIQNVRTNGNLSISVTAGGASIQIGQSDSAGHGPRPIRSIRPVKPVRSVRPVKPVMPVNYGGDGRVTRRHDQNIARWERRCEQVERQNARAEARWERACERVERQNERAQTRWERQSPMGEIDDAMSDVDDAMLDAEDRVEDLLRESEDVIDNALDW